MRENSYCLSYRGNHSPPSTTFVPSSGSTVCDTQPDLDWADVTVASLHRIQGDNDNTFGSVHITNDNTTAYDLNDKSDSGSPISYELFILPSDCGHNTEGYSILQRKTR